LTKDTLLSALDLHAERRGDETFLVLLADGAESRFTFREFRQRALSFAEAIDRMPGGRGDVIFIVLKHRAELYFAFIGAMYAGRIPSFLPFPTPKQDSALYWSSHRELFRRVKPAAILSYGENIAPLESVLSGIDTVALDIDQISLGSSSSFVPSPPAADDTALLQHSSGTTGLKKGVMLSFAQIAA